MTDFDAMSQSELANIMYDEDRAVTDRVQAYLRYGDDRDTCLESELLCALWDHCVGLQRRLDAVLKMLGPSVLKASDYPSVLEETTIGIYEAKIIARTKHDLCSRAKAIAEGKS